MKSITEVQKWDLEDLDAFLAVQDMVSGQRAAAEEYAEVTAGQKGE